MSNQAKKIEYTVVSAVYNVEKYLKDFFISLTKQSIGFDCIKLVMVDDGSTDDSAYIINQWKEKYPENIVYIYKNNGGQASARNVGIKYVNTEWVTFIDPDDFISLDYFKNIEIYKESSPIIDLLSCNFIFYYEKNRKYSDTHPLKYRFVQEHKIWDLNQATDFLQLSASTAFFKREIIINNNIVFNEEIQPSFEDAEFVGKYLLYSPQQKVLTLRKAKYFYRKRADNSSALNMAQQDIRSYTKVLELGCLGLLEKYLQRYGYIPYWLQRVVLYHIAWLIKPCIGKENYLNFLSSQQRKIFLLNLKKIFSYIEVDTIMKFNLAGIWFLHKVGLISFFKKCKILPFQICYIKDLDLKTQELSFYYFSGSSKSNVEIYLDHKPITLSYSKIRRYEIENKGFVYQNIITVKCSDEAKNLKITIEEVKTQITLAKKKYDQTITLAEITKFFKEKNSKVKRDNWISFFFTKALLYIAKVWNLENSWVFMDRILKGDDNAEHLYRYVKKKSTINNIYYVISKKSPDWLRLKKEGFNLINYGSLKHKISMCYAKYFISSHIDQNILSPKMPRNLKSLVNYKFMFLQHGVIKDDLSNWLNTKEINYFITSNKNEYNSIAGDFTNYTLTKKEVKLTGLARHDSLIIKSKTISPEKIILISPTWRKSLFTMEKHGVWKPKDTFCESLFFKNWNSLLNNKYFEELVKKSGYKIEFFLHPALSYSINYFNLPEYIALHNSYGKDTFCIQSLLAKSNLLITDFSSIAFEMAVMRRPVIYYQFDNIFGEEHTYSKGYFDYEKDGFGPVCREESKVIVALQELKKSNFYDKKYLSRMKRAIPFVDGKCCERIYNILR